MENYKISEITKTAYGQLEIGDTYIEIWKGLPNFKFEKAKSSNNKSTLLYENKQSKDYIWVINDAVKALDGNPEAILLAHLSKTKSGNIDAFYVTKLNNTENLESMIDKVN